MKIQLFNNSCFILELGEIKLLFDPYLSTRELKKLSFDYAVISHAHLDHMLFANRIKVPIIAPPGIQFKDSDIPLWGSMKLHEISIHPIHAIHPRWFQKNFLYDYVQSLLSTFRLLRCKCSFGFVLQYNHETIYYSGDTLYSQDIFEFVKEQFKPTVCLVAFENHHIPSMKMLVHIREHEKLTNLFDCPVIPVHQTRLWYKNHLHEFVSHVEVPYLYCDSNEWFINC